MLGAQGHSRPQPQPQLQPEQPKKRQMVMCPRCRRDKQLCKFDEGTSWPAHKCVRCEQMRYDCGKPERKARAARTPRLSHGALPTPTREPEATQNKFGIETAPSHLSDNALAMALQTDAVVVPRLGHSDGVRIRPLPAAFGLGEYAGSPDTNPPSSQYSEDIAGPSRKDLEIQARRLLTVLGDHLGVKAILSSDQRICNKVASWRGEASHEAVRKVTLALETAISSLTASFRSTLETATSFATRNLGGCKMELLAQLMLFESRFASECDRPDTSMTTSDALREMFFAQQRRKGSCSEADNLCTVPFNSSNIESSPPTDTRISSSEADLVQRHMIACHDITRILAGLVFNNASHRELLLGSELSDPTGPILTYPAGHLAILTAPTAVHFQLWRCRATVLPWEIDCLRRTPVHIAAFFGRLESLIHVFREDPATARGFLPDLLGLTPVQIAVCRNDVRGFNILCQFDPEARNTLDGEGRSLLALAARNGSEGIVEAILSSRVIPISLRSELDEAIVGGHKGIVQSLVFHLRSNSPWSSFTSEIEQALNTAKDLGQIEIVDMLDSALFEARPGSEEILSSLDIFDFEAYASRLETGSDTQMQTLDTMWSPDQHDAFVPRIVSQ